MLNKNDIRINTELGYKMKVTNFRKPNQLQWDKGIKLVLKDEEIYRQQVIESHRVPINTPITNYEYQMLEFIIKKGVDLESLKKTIISIVGYNRPESQTVVNILSEYGVIFDIVTDADPYIINMLYGRTGMSENDIEDVIYYSNINGYKISKLTYKYLLEFNEDVRQSILKDTWNTKDYGTLDCEAEEYSLLLDMLEL